MPVKARRHKARAHRITDAAVEAFSAGEYSALHTALGLRPWEPSPLPLAVEPLGVDPDQPPSPGRPGWGAGWPLAVELQRELIAAGAKAPTRAADIEEH